MVCSRIVLKIFLKKIEKKRHAAAGDARRTLAARTFIRHEARVIPTAQKNDTTPDARTKTSAEFRE